MHSVILFVVASEDEMWSEGGYMEVSYVVWQEFSGL